MLLTVLEIKVADPGKPEPRKSYLYWREFKGFLFILRLGKPEIILGHFHATVSPLACE